MISASRSKEFLSGFSSPFRVLGLLLEHPSLFLLFILPMALTLLVLSCVIFALIAGTWSASQALFHSILGHTFGIGSGIFSFIAGLAIVYSSMFIMNLLIQLLSSPFNDLLAERTEMALGEPPSKTGLMWAVFVFWIDLKKTALNLLLTIFFSLLGLIPGVGLMALPGLAMVQAFTFLSYPQNRRKDGIRASWAWIKENPYRSLGFGTASLLLFTIPVINLFALPISVIAGTITYLRK